MTTLIDKLKTRFGLSRVCLIGDRGTLTSARTIQELRPVQLDWISALRAPQTFEPLAVSHRLGYTEAAATRPQREFHVNAHTRQPTRELRANSYLADQTQR